MFTPRCFSYLRAFSPQVFSALSCLLILISPIYLTISITTAPSAYAQDNPTGEGEIKESETEINVKNAEISQIVRIFSKKTKRNYILDERVKGKVTIYLPGKVSAEESLRILESVLMLKGFTTVPIGENLWKIIPAKDAKQTTIPTVIDATGESPSPALVTRLLNLKYVNAEDMQQILAPLISPDGLLNAYGGTNSLLIIDSEENIRRLEELIAAIDIASSEQDMTLIPIKNADAKDIADKLGTLLGTGGSEKESGTPDLLRSRSAAMNNPNPGLPNSVNVNPGMGIQASSSPMMNNVNSSGPNPRTRTPKILADERTNSIIVVADEDTTARVKALISQLDSKLDKSGNRFYVYHCQHAKAQELADVLSGLAGGGGSSGSKSNTSIGDGESLLTGSKSRGSSGSSLRSPSSSRSGDGEGLTGSSGRRLGDSRLSSGGSGVQTAMLGEDVSVTADPSTNSLIIFSGKADYEKLLELLRQLDVKRRQVLVEATLLEVQMTDDNSLGVDFLGSGGGKDGGFFTQKGFNNLAQLIQDPGGLSGFTAAVASAGTLTIGDALTVPSQAMLVRAAQSTQNANILSAPQLLTTDNEEAVIVVGQNVPFVSSSTRDSSNTSNSTTQISREDVGITLRITPQISSENFVTLKIFTEVSSIVADSRDNSNGPTTNLRTSETTVIAKDSQMIVIGGLLSDDVTESNDGVPFMKDIPVLGHLFKNTRERFEKRNLLIFISPKIIRDQFDARDTSREKASSLSDEVAKSSAVRDRSGVLQSPKLDTVTESEEYKGPLPSTILPPVSEGTASPSARLNPSSGTFATDSPGVVQVKIKPKLIPEATSLKASRFVVIQLLSNNALAEISEQLPFSVDELKNGYLELPQDASPDVTRFFAPGEKVSYRIGDATIQFAVKESRRERDARYPWYTLSPHEILRLGDAPWSK